MSDAKSGTYYGFKDSIYCFTKQSAAELCKEELEISAPVITRAEMDCFQSEKSEMDDCMVAPPFLFKLSVIITVLQSITIVLDWNFFLSVIGAGLLGIILYFLWLVVRWRYDRWKEKKSQKHIDRCIFKWLRRRPEIEVTTLDILRSQTYNFDNGVYYGWCKLKVYNK